MFGFFGIETVVVSLIVVASLVFTIKSELENKNVSDLSIDMPITATIVVLIIGN